MSGPLSIFQKVCPSCAAQIAVDADTCAFGHEFEAAGNNSTSTEEQALRDEELYENYLAARAGQAAEAARAAADWLAEEPDNSDRANAAQLAQEVAASLEADLQQQRAKISAMRRVLPRLRSTPPPAKPAAAATPKAAGANPPAAAPRAVNAGTLPSAPPATLRPAAAPTITTPAPRPSAVAAGPAPAAGVAPASMTSASKAAAALEAIKLAKAREAAAATVTATPPDSFRAEQAARAARAIADKPAAADSKDCPNCTASVPLATTRCRCGFAFVTGTNNLPTLTLCTGDFTALRNSLKLNLGK